MTHSGRAQSDPAAASRNPSLAAPAATQSGQPLPGKKVLVTGASGFIGTRLVERLVESHVPVRCLVRATSNTTRLEELGVELCRGELRDPHSLRAAVSGVDCVFHLAAVTQTLEVANFYEVNTNGTGYLAQACYQLESPPTFVYCSSVAAAGPVPRGRVRTVHDPPQPVSHYGKSKRGGELTLEMLTDRLPVTIVRPGIVFGPGSRETLPMFEAVRRFRCHLVPGFRLPPLSWIHVDDAIEILLRAAQFGRRLPDTGAPQSGEGSYFAAVDEFPNYLEVGRMVRRAVLRPHAWLVVVPEPVPWVVGVVANLLSRYVGISSPLTLDKIVEASATNWACSPAEVIEQLDFRPPTKLSTQFGETARWYFDAGWLQ